MASTIPQLSILSGETVSRRRYEGDYVNGRYVQVEDTLAALDDIPASVQPPNRSFQELIQQLPEAQRKRQWIQVYCEVHTFRGVDDRTNTPADVVIYSGDRYVVHRATPRQGRRLRHDAVLAVLEDIDGS